MKALSFVRFAGSIALGLGLSLSVQSAQAGSATWDLDPATNLWNTAANWTPDTVPNDPSDNATFGLSNTTGVAVSATTEVNQILFGSGASPFTITVNAPAVLTIDGGVVNTSGTNQNLVAGPGSSISLGGQIAAQDPVTYEVKGSDSSGVPGYMILQAANAGNATYILDGGSSTSAFGGIFQFYRASTGDTCTVVVNGGAAPLARSAYLEFGGDGTYPAAGNGNYTINGGAAKGALGGGGDVLYGTTLQTSTFTVNGGTVAGAGGGILIVDGGATADQATLVVNGAVAGATGGQILFAHDALGATARVEAFDRGSFDISLHVVPGVTIGSLEGNGVVFLGSDNLAVGSVKRNTVFSGSVRDGGYAGGTGGSFTKIGRGMLTLSGASSYTGGTTVSEGTLLVNNSQGSATGTGAVLVSGGRLGGKGIVAGAVTVGAAARSALAPGGATAQPLGTLTVQGAVTFTGRAVFEVQLNSDRGHADRLSANGVTIGSNATLSASELGSSSWGSGTTFTVIENTSADPISGTFANLADDAIITIGSTDFQASYEGGDGNDLTLTVVP